MDKPATDSLRIFRDQVLPVKSLKGFRSGYRVPDDINDRTRAFVARAGHDDIDAELDGKFESIRKQLKLKRLDLKVDGPESGFAAIRTPWFEYQVVVTQSTDVSSDAVLRTQLTAVNQPDILSDDSFLSVFGTSFDSVEFDPANPIDIEAFIDHLEDGAIESVRLEYDRSGTWCEVEAEGIPGRLFMEASLVRLTFPQIAPPADLLAAFVDLYSQLGLKGNSEGSLPG